MAVDLDLSAQVWTADGHMIGLLSGVVIGPDRLAVTHLVVRYGLIVAVDRVVPIADLEEVDDHRLRLNLTTRELGELPELEVHSYISLGGVDTGSDARPALSAPGLWTRTPAIALPPLVSDHTSDQANVEEVWRNVPEGSLVLREGLAVRVAKGRRVGSLKEVAFEPGTGALARVVISRHGHVKAVPPAWIVRSDEETGIVLAVDRRAVDELPDYH